MDESGFVDKLGRELREGDLCLRLLKGGFGYQKPSFKVVRILEFRAIKAKIADRSYVDPLNLIKLTDEGLDETYLNRIYVL